MKDKTILITGGAGFLGSNLARRLLAQGANVTLCDNLSRKGSERNLEKIKKEFPQIKISTVEIADAPNIIARARPDLVYHFAAQVAVTSSVISPINDFKINAEGTFRVAETAGNFGIPVIYSSTNKVYGDNVNNVPIREMDTRYDFDGELKERGIDENFSIDAGHHTPYGCSKLAGELYVREYGGVVNRFSCMYGRYQNGIIDQGWLSYFVIQKLLKKPITIFGDGKQVRDAVHADDVIELLEIQGKRLFDPQLPSIQGEVFTIGGGYKNSISLLELCSRLEIQPRFEDWRPADQKVFYCDIGKAQRVLGWSPKVSVEKGLTDLVLWTGRDLNLEEK
jgi:CDP-paratose 2-epimerase